MSLRPYIFLDFDGVIAVYEPAFDNLGRPLPYRGDRDWKKAKKRGKLMDDFLYLIDARLVISSNWRYGQSRKGTTKQELQATMGYYLGVKHPIHAMLPLGTFSRYGDEGRDRLILDFVHRRRIKSPWLAFDDMLLEGIDDQHKITTDDEIGVTPDDLSEAIRRLDSQL